MSERTVVFVVDRVEGDVVVLIPDEGEAIEVPGSALPGHIGEGAVIRVPLAEAGTPEWARAERDRDLEDQLIEEGRQRLDRLKRRDPGGDIAL
jgi:hypothetical protein